ncbi:WG repeat-containing protein [uncultured Alistipes sp.]|uniref:WG repeat-containing protein n=1 Tax=uncultured Alistipes sp. TaxID=538949 RepID=UPI0025E511AE|nr:WG repeat-containing protein [uncultured Alistipes sp.]
MIKKLVLLLLIVAGACSLCAQNVEGIKDYYSSLQTKRKTYRDYANEKENLLKLSESRDPAQITAEFQSKLSQVTSSYQEIYHSKVAAFSAGVGAVQSQLSGGYSQIGTAVGGVLRGIQSNSARRSAEEQAERDRQKLELEFEDKFISLREDLLREKRMSEQMYLMAAAYQFSEDEERKYLDLANYVDCECQYIQANFSLGSTTWINSNCPRPATNKYAAVAAYKEPGVPELLAAIERKLSIPNIHFIRAARDFADIGLAKSPNHPKFLFYKAYLSEDIGEQKMFTDEMLRLNPKNKEALAINDYVEIYTSYSKGSDAVRLMDYARNIDIQIPGNPFYIVCKEVMRNGGFVFPFVRDGKMYYIFPNGERAIADTFDFCTIFMKGFARVMKDGLWGVINKDGTYIVPCLYEELGAYLRPANLYWNTAEQATNLEDGNVFDRWGYVGVKKITGKFGILSAWGKWIVEPEETFAPVMVDKDRVVKMSEKGNWELFDTNDNQLTKKGIYWSRRTLISTDRYMEGLLKVVNDVNFKGEVKSWTFLDRNGKNAFAHTNFYITDIVGEGFVDGRCQVVVGGETITINTKGERVN